MIDIQKYKITIENKKGSYKSFIDSNIEDENAYPLEGVTYPVDYGSIAGYVGEDGDDLDIFIGTGNVNGYIKVWRLDVPEETKFFISLKQNELDDIIKTFEPVMIEYKILTDDTFEMKIKDFKTK